MNTSGNTWLGQVTTGHGCMILTSTLLAVLSGAMTLPVALPLLAAGLIGLVWPENTPLRQAAAAAVSDIEATIAAYRGGPRVGAVPPAPGPGPAGLAAFAVASLSLAACAGQTADQQAAELRAVETGIVCLAGTGARVAAVSATDAPDAVKAANAAAALGTELTNDPACAMAGVPVAPKP